MEWLKEWALPLSAGATLLAVFVALGIGIASIKHTQSMQRKERRERLLNEIIEWAEEIDKASLIPDITLTPKNTKLMKKQREANVLMRYGISLSRVTSIETIASVSFESELLQDVSKVTDTVFKFTCIYHLKSLGVLPPETAISGKAREEIKQEVDEGKKSVDQLWEEYAVELANTIRALLFKANIIKANLLK